MSKDMEVQVKIRAQELCRKYANVNQYQIAARNKKIIEKLMEEFGISKDFAELCFINNHEI